MSKSKILDFDQLTKEQLKQLASTTDVQDVRILGDTYTDDHILCFNARFTDQDGRKWCLTFLWAGPESYCAAKWAEYPKPREEFIGLVKENAKNALDNAE